MTLPADPPGATIREGRTVLFVSHNMAAIAELTTRALLLDAGSIAADTRTADAIAAYLSKRAQQPVYVNAQNESCEAPHIARAEILTSHPSGIQYFGAPLGIRLWLRHLIGCPQGHLGIQIVNQAQVVTAAVYAYPPQHEFGRDPGGTFFEFHIPSLHLNIGKFHLRIWVSGPPGTQVYEVVDACDFEVVRHDFLNWWTPQSCAYHEDFSVRITRTGPTTRPAEHVTESEPLLAGN